MRVILILLFTSGAALAQPATQPEGCASAAAWRPCDLSFELASQENAEHAELRAEFRSPRFKTYLLRAFRDDRKLIMRFAPTEAGKWTYRLTSNLARLDGQTGSLTAAESSAPAFVRVANVHHFADENLKQHLWMSTDLERFTDMPRPEFERLVEQRSQEKFTHLRVTIDAATDFSEAAARLRNMNDKGLIADVVLAAIPADGLQREAYVTGIVARFCAFNITWGGTPSFETLEHGRFVMKEIGGLLKKLDPYDHPRTTLAAGTSAALAGDGWMNVLSYGTADQNLGSVEHQFYQLPALNVGIRSQQDLWNATMNGQYPASGSGPHMKAWAEFMAGNRYWELEPYFDVDGGRALALEGVEYIVYVEKPGLVELTVENHSYEVAWMNPASGEMTKQKDYKGEHFTGEPPDKLHDWVLRVSREGHKAGMLKSYKFDSRPVPVQEVELNPLKIPFEIAAPAGTELSLSNPGRFAAKIKRDSRATRALLVEWTAEVPLDGEGYRVVGTGREGTLRIPKSIATRYPAVMNLHLMLLNANGKAYALDRVYTLNP